MTVAGGARSLPGTYGQPKVPFVFAHPSTALLPEASVPRTCPCAVRVDFPEWPKSLAEIATQPGQAAKSR